MPNMSRLRVAIICTALGLVVGAVGGFFVGEQVGKVWLRFWHESMVQQGYQAYTVLGLMEQGESERLHEYLENEVDSALELFDSEEFTKTGRYYERLQEYRSTHPR